MPAQAESPTDKRLVHTVLALLAVSLIMISRQPVLLVEPRVWWDEARIGFAYAYHRDYLSALITPHRGYYNFVNKLVAMFQVMFFSVANAPLLSAYVAFAVQLLPHAIIWGGRSACWRTPAQRATASVIVLFTTLDCSIWLNVVTSQFHLSLVAFLLLAEQWQGRSRRCLAVYAALVFICGLTGVMSCFLIPFYAWKAYRERSRFAYVVLASLFAAAVLQFTAVVWSQLVGTRNRRFYYYTNPFHFLTYYILGTVYMPFYNVPPFVYLDQAHGGLPKPAALVITPLCTLALGLATWYFGKALPKRERLLFIGGFYWMSLLCLLTAIVDYNIQERYFYASNVIMMLMLHQGLFLQGREHDMRQILAGILLGMVIISGLWRFYADFPCYSSYWQQWRDEVAIWQRKPGYDPLAHPIDPEHVRRVTLDPSRNRHRMPVF